MFRTWHHGHSLGAGVLVGLLISRRPELVFAAGVASTLAAFGLWRLGRTLLAAFEAWRDRSRARRVVTAKSWARHRSDDIPY